MVLVSLGLRLVVVWLIFETILKDTLLKVMVITKITLINDFVPCLGAL